MSIDSGKCGESLDWYYDESTRELTISGTGVMDEFEIIRDTTNEGWDFDGRPWMHIINKIRTIVIGDGAFNISLEAFLGAASLEKVVVKGICLRIDSAAFAHCQNLKQVSFEHSDAENAYVMLKQGAFAHCDSLEYINLPKNGTLEDKVFYNCHSLCSIRIPNGTRVIKDYTFFDCRNLVEVEIPNTVECIEPDAFDGCDNLKQQF